MTLTVIVNPIGPTTPASPLSIIAVKQALNRLGEYFPFATIGMNGITDSALFLAIKNFQRKNNIFPSGQINPNDKTIKVLNSKLKKQDTEKGYYIWRSVNDDKVRDSHAQYNGTIRSWNEPMRPGKDYNCRCWAEPVNIPIGDQKYIDAAIKDLSYFEKHNFHLSQKLFLHYLQNSGKTLTLLPDSFDNFQIIKESTNKNTQRFIQNFQSNEKFRKQFSNLKEGQIIRIKDYWDVDLSRFKISALPNDLNLAIGSAKVRSFGDFTLQRTGSKIQIKGNITHTIHDIYDFNKDTILDRLSFENERMLAEKGYAKPFKIQWEKIEPIEYNLKIDR